MNEFEKIFKSLNAIAIPVDSNISEEQHDEYFKIINMCIPANMSDFESEQDVEEYYIHMLNRYISLYASNLTSSVNSMLMQNYTLSIKDYFKTYNELPF